MQRNIIKCQESCFAHKEDNRKKDDAKSNDTNETE